MNRAWLWNLKQVRVLSRRAGEQEHQAGAGAEEGKEVFNKPLIRPTIGPMRLIGPITILPAPACHLIPFSQLSQKITELDDLRYVFSCAFCKPRIDNSAFLKKWVFHKARDCFIQK